jgi:hypothetical protein
LANMPSNFPQTRKPDQTVAGAGCQSPTGVQTALTGGRDALTCCLGI